MSPAPTPLLLLVLKATLVLLLALGVARLLARASAGLRHLVWLASLGGLLLVPLLDLWSPLRLSVLPPAREAVPAVIPSGPGVAAPLVSEAPASGALPAAPAPEAFDAPGWTLPSLDALQLAFLLWGVVALALLLATAWSWIAVRRIVRRARPLDTRDWLDPLYEVADRFGLEDAPRLLRSDDALMPFACGVVRPTIVLPAESDGWTTERRRAVLLHELAHVRRRDLVGHTLGRVACAVYWFHPLVWAAARHLRNESERACDDMALACGAHAPDYAEHLLEIVTSVRSDRTPVVAMAMARRSEFEGRMLAILDPERRRGTPGWRQALALAAGLGFMSVAIGAAAPVRRSLPEIDVAQASPSAGSPIGGTVVPVDTGADKRESLVLADSKRAEKIAEREWKKVETKTARAVARASTGAELEKVFALQGRQGKGSDDERAVLLAKVLRTDTSAALRRVAAWGLAEHAESAVAYEALANALRRDPSAAVREMSAWALGESGKGARIITESLGAAVRGDADQKVRSTAAWALGSIGDEDGVDALVAALRDASADVRVRAAWAIGSIEPDRAPAPLLAALGDAEPKVRKAVAWALYTIEDPAGVPALKRALASEKQKDLEAVYIRALAALGEQSVDAIRDLVDSPDPRVRDMAVRALAGGNAAGPWPWPWPEPRPYP